MRIMYRHAAEDLVHVQGCLGSHAADPKACIYRILHTNNALKESESNQGMNGGI